MIIRCCSGSLCCSASRLRAQEAGAQEYPARTIRLIIPFAPGGANDILGRLIAARLSETVGQQVVPDNRPGAGGSIGAELVSKSPPDGYMLVIGHIGTLAVNPTLYRKLGYNPVSDFQPISLVAKVPSIMVVHPSVPARSLKELIALAKSRPGALVYGSGGNGGAGHLATEYFKLMAKVDMVHVPYRGTGAALVDLIAGQTQLVFAGVPGAAAHVRSGRLRALGVSTSTRLAVFPELPTIAEAGVPGYEVTQWYGVLAPAGTPKAVVDRLHKEIVSAVKSKQMHERLTADGSEPITSTPEEFASYIKSEIARWAPVIRAAGIRVD
ncbi:MAG: tripartite tricarboxylate transporter substrate binding protein [Betaproteobacteria bacterium]|nr:tripartite tricarboxylate transporter substrate binding protein [Betaproteobacteria bacterium]